MGWISVEDRLPELGVEVDIFKHGRRMTNWYLDKYSPTDETLFWYSGKSNLFEVESIQMLNSDYWMPLPEPPKE